MIESMLVKMMALCVALLVVPIIAIGQKKNVISTHRVFPKVDKVLEFEKALANHAQKYHKGDVAWRVFEIQSGPDFGGYHITEGPNSWDGLDTRGNLGDDHNLDCHKSIATHLTDRQSASFAVYQDSLSTVGIGDHSDKINITHVFPKAGMDRHVRDIIKRLRKVWVDNGVTRAVYALNFSGPSQYALVTRYKQGLKEKEEGFRKPGKELYEKIHGDDSYNLNLDDINKYTEESWSELLYLKMDLSSK